MNSTRNMVRPQLVEIDSLNIRVAIDERAGVPALLLLSPWPESIYAYAGMWDQLAEHFSLVAMDLPGFGGSEGRADLMGPRQMGDFVVKAAVSLGLSNLHAVGPDIGTSTLLFAASRHPSAFRSIQVGGGSTASPPQATGLLRQLIDTADLTEFRTADPAPLVATAARSIPGYDIPAEIVDDYVASYSGDRFGDSIAFVQSYPAQLSELAPLLARIETPVQILASRDDPFTPVSEPRQLANELSNSGLVILPNGHNAWEEDPARYAEALISWVVKVESQTTAGR